MMFEALQRNNSYTHTLIDTLPANENAHEGCYKREMSKPYVLIIGPVLIR